MPSDKKPNEPKKYTIGILEVQGAFLEHKVALLAAAKQHQDGVIVDVVSIRNASHITSDVDGMIIPGGESTAISLFLKRNNMEAVLKDWVSHRNHVTWGTCAGMILLSKFTEHQKEGGQSSLGALDTVVSRNYFGRQINSFEADLIVDHPELLSSNSESSLFRGVFIRAPAVIKTTDPSVEILSTMNNKDSNDSVIVACRQGNILATAFHPELTEDTRWHRYFLRMIISNTQPGPRSTKRS